MIGALPFLMETLNAFYGKNVIVLVDEHDGPVQSIHDGISFESSSDNSELMKSIELLAETISILLGAMAKSNKYLHKFLMVGVSDAVVSFSNSGFNNLFISDVLSTTYSQFFALSEGEINYIVEKVFEGIEQNHKEKIMENLKTWYDGYYFKEHERLYSIYSTICYLDECYRAYSTITPGRKDDGWIPKPEPQWTRTSSEKSLKKAFSMKFETKFHDFFFNLCSNFSGYYSDIDGRFSPILKDPNVSTERGKIAFYSLLNGGYLTRGDKGDTHFKIPNYEILIEFKKQMAEYLNSLPLEKESISKLRKATLSEDFYTFGIEMTKSLHSLYLKRKIGSQHFLEREVQNLMLKYLEELKRNGDYDVLNDHEVDPASDEAEEFRIDIHLVPTKGENKPHYIIELKKYDKYDGSIQEKALYALRKICVKKYYRHIIKSDDTTPVILMGIAAHYDSICLVTLKVGVKNGEITVGTEPIRLQRFRITGKDGDKIVLEYVAPEDNQLHILDGDLEKKVTGTSDEDYGKLKYTKNERAYIVRIKEWMKKLNEQEKRKSKNEITIWHPHNED
jgi:hypothetical protein